MTEEQEKEQTEEMQPVETPELDRQAPVDGCVELRVLENGGRAEMRLFEPQFGGKPVSREALVAKLAEEKVVYGIKEEVLLQLAAQPVYGEAVIVAEAKPAIHGTDGYLWYFFDLEEKLSPIENDQGIVDFRNLNFIQNVDKDQKLAEIIPPTVGVEGVNVWGQTLEAAIGKPVEEPNGENTYLADDGRMILAACAGSPKVKKGKVIVSRVITVDNVDISTGNLLYVGAIVIRGNVSEGFTVSASEGIVIKGTAENAKLISGKNISVGQGISGNRSRVIAGGDLRSGFLENCTVEVRGDVYADAILHADIKCEGSVHASGRRGCIIGGACRAAHMVTARDIGNEKYIPTTIEVYGTYLLDNKLEETQKKLSVQQEMIKKDEELLQKLALLQRLQRSLPPDAWDNAQLTKEQNQQKLTQLEEDLQKQQEAIANFGECKITVEGHLYENVTLIIRDIKEESDMIRTRCTAFLVDGVIVYR